MNARFFSLALFAGSLIPFSVSAQCTAPCALEEARFGTALDYRLAKALVHEEKRLWSRVRLGTAVVDASQASLADQRVVPWPANDPLQPRLQVIKAKLLLYDDPDPSRVSGFSVALESLEVLAYGKNPEEDSLSALSTRSHCDLDRSDGAPRTARCLFFYISRYLTWPSERVLYRVQFF